MGAFLGSLVKENHFFILLKKLKHKMVHGSLYLSKICMLRDIKVKITLF